MRVKHILVIQEVSIENRVKHSLNCVTIHSLDYDYTN